MDPLTWGVCSRDRTARVHCMRCRAAWPPVPLGEARAELERVKKLHKCS